MEQLNLEEWAKKQGTKWIRREYEHGDCLIIVKMDETANYRGWYDVIFECYDPMGKPKLQEFKDVKAGWDEIQLYIDHWMPQLEKGDIPSGIPIYKLRQVRGEAA